MGIVLTELELEPDPIMEPGTLCNKCMACIHACPGQAMPADKTVKVKLGGYDVEWTDIDCRKCDITFRGAEYTGEVQADPYMSPDYGNKTVPGAWSPFNHKPRNLYNTGQAVCGARGCTRACMISMETRGAVENKFHQKFRRRPQWSVDWSKPVEEPGDSTYVEGEAD